MDFTRREFLGETGAAVLILSLGNLHVRASAQGLEGGKSRGAVNEYDYRTWEDIYREKWRWDRVVKGTHLRANCASACSWDLYIKEGIVWREEQAAVYSATNPSLPDFNPRGCQKGACYSSLMVSPSRIKHPLKRTGPRGSGRWRRISWEEALAEIADKIIDVCLRDGPESIIYDHGATHIDFGPSTAGEMLFFHLLGATHLDSLAGVGDLPMGAVQTWGLAGVDGTADDWFHSDYIVVWGMNPVYTRIPEAHFLWEARYRGATVVAVAPDYNATSIHTDLWLNPRVGTDAALALGMANVIVTEKLCDEAYIKEQTDLPLLVRTDTSRFLRERDLKRGGREDVFYLWDRKTDKLTEAPGARGYLYRSLQLKEIDPALEGRYEASLAEGHTVTVRPAFDLLKDRLAAYTPENAGRITGLAPGLIRKVGRDFAGAKAALILASYGTCKHYHSDLMQRAMILLAALTGNQGKRGGGLRFNAWWTMAGFESLASAYELNFLQKLAFRLFKPQVRIIEQYMTKMIRERHRFTPTMPWLWVHGGQARGAYRGPPLKRDIDAYIQEALDKDWTRLLPDPGKDPKVYFCTCGNPLRRWPAPQVMEKHLWPKFDLVVDVNPRMSTTGLKSDFILPAAGYYEKRGIKYTQSYLPYVVLGDKAVEPLGEAKGEWEIFGLLSKKVQERAKERKVKPYPDAMEQKRDLAKMYDEWSFQGRFDLEDDERPLDYILENSDIIKGLTWKQAAEKGTTPIQGIGRYAPGNAVCSDYQPGETVYPSQWFVEKKEPWPTLTGRQQFYIDHPWYLEEGEELPVHKDAPAAGGNHPLRMTGGHTRWSIHALWRDEEQMLRLQRGEPVLYMGARDAAARGIHDHDRARVFNDVGSFRVRVKVSPAVQPGQVVIYHAWEPYQFKGWQSSQEPIPAAWKPLHLVGDYGQLHYRVASASPHYSPRAAAVEVKRE